MGNTAGGGSMSRALVSDGGSILSSTGSMDGGGSMSRALISDGGSILSSTGSMGGGGSMSRGLISDGGSIMSSTKSMGGGGLLSRALISDGGSIMSYMGSVDGSTEHNRSMMFGLQDSSYVPLCMHCRIPTGLFYVWKLLPFCCWRTFPNSCSSNEQPKLYELNELQLHDK
ncbi:unnamed protein product [Brassica rapa subsp. trilocularis]